MAGTRLIAQAIYCVCALFAWLIAWNYDKPPRFSFPKLEIKNKKPDVSIALSLQYKVLINEASSEERILAKLIAANTSAVFESLLKYPSEHSTRIDLKISKDIEKVAIESSSNFDLHSFVNDFLLPFSSKTHLYTIFMSCDVIELGFYMSNHRHGILSFPCSSYDSLDHKSHIISLLKLGTEIFLSEFFTRAVIADKFDDTTSHSTTFTLLSQDPAERKCAWDFQHMSQANFISTLEMIRPIKKFHVQSQEIFYGELADRANIEAFSSKNPSMPGNGFFLASNDLQNFEKLNSQIFQKESYGFSETAEKFSQFVVFCPKLSSSPLSFYSDSKDKLSIAFESQEFGTIVVYNPSQGAHPQLNTDEVDSKFFTDSVVPLFISHIRKILGVRQDYSFPQKYFIPCTDLNLQCKIVNIEAIPPNYPMALTMWEFDALLFYQLQNYRSISIKTLQALVQLTDSISRIHITEHVSNMVLKSLEELNELDFYVGKEAIPLLNSNNSVPEYFDLLRLAENSWKLSESAYSNPSVMPSEYFPEIHLLAIFMPLIAPLIMPLFLGLLKEIQRYKQKVK